MAQSARRKVVVCVIIGIVLVICLAQSEYLLLAPALDPVARLLYRVAYFVVLPLRGLVFPILPETDHHWSLLHTCVVGVSAPFAFWAFGHWRKRRRMARRKDPREAARRSRRSNAMLLDRRQFLTRSAAGAACVATGGYAGFVEPSLLAVQRYDVPIDDLPRDLDGLRVVHISDTHYGPFTALDYLERVVRQANDLRPDLVVLTGDYVHRTARAIDAGIGVLGGLKARFGSVAVLGNHEHWEGAAACREALGRLGVPVLDNGRVFLGRRGVCPSDEGGAVLCVAGVGDLWEGQVLPETALRDVGPRTPRVLLSHNPDVVEQLPQGLRVDLMFAGHTHGGQVWFPVIGTPFHKSKYGDKYMGGICRGPVCPIIVSRGVGLAGIPVRFLVPPEVGLITLKCPRIGLV
ncbi:MAG TPA: metallophosphoesterase [Candidatus Hydrogenedentes bacterium]|nr:metallophosphoesterase [Candidatus Hydrogenedentota bacterium]